LKLRLKEDPKEWRKTTWLTVLPLAVICSLLRWRGIIATPVWLGVLGLLCVIAFCAWVQPGWFRGYYRGSTRVGYAISQVVARVVLWLLFLLVLTPLGLLLRLSGKDLLRLKRSPEAGTYWTEARESSPLDRLF